MRRPLFAGRALLYVALIGGFISSLNARSTAAGVAPSTAPDTLTPQSPESSSGAQPDNTPADLSLAELLDLKVTTVSRKAQFLSEAPSNISVVTAQQIHDWGCRNMKDLLRRVVGFPIVPDRDEWVFAVRGNLGDNNQKYLILIDGHRMNSIENFGPGQIIEMPNNLSSVKRVEIIRGPGSAVWGPDALAGVVNIITKTPEDIGGAVCNSSITGVSEFYKETGRVRYGEGGVVDFQAGKRFSTNIDMMLMGAIGYSDGEPVVQARSNPFPKNLITPEQTVISATDSASQTTPGTFRTILDRHKAPAYMLQVKGRAGDFSLNALAFSTETYNRQVEWGSGRESYLTTYKSFVEGAYATAVADQGLLSLRVSSDLNRAEYQPTSQDDSIVLPANMMTDIVWLDRRLNASAEFLWQFRPVRASLSGGMDYSYTKAGPNQRLNKLNLNETADQASKDTSIHGFWFDPLLEDHQTGGYLMGDIRPWHFFGATAGCRLDYNAQRGSDRLNVNPRLALMLFPGTRTSVKMIYNRGYLRPANFQSAFVKDSVKSETMDQVDVVWTQEVWKARFTVTGYWQRLSGFINLFPGGSYDFRNTADYSSIGAEIEAALALGNHDVWGNLYYARATAAGFPRAMAYNNRRVDMDGNLLSYPRYIGNLGATFRLVNRKFHISPNVRVVAPTKYRTVGINKEAFDREDYYATTPRFAYLNLGAGFDPVKQVGLNIYLDNITNITDPVPLSVWNGTIDQTGFSLAGKLTLRLGAKPQ